MMDKLCTMSVTIITEKGFRYDVSYDSIGYIGARPDSEESHNKTMEEVLSLVINAKNKIQDSLGTNVARVNPHACFGRKPHPMDFDDNDEYHSRSHAYNTWEAQNYCSVCHVDKPYHSGLCEKCITELPY